MRTDVRITYGETAVNAFPDNRSAWTASGLPLQPPSSASLALISSRRRLFGSSLTARR